MKWSLSVNSQREDWESGCDKRGGGGCKINNFGSSKFHQFYRISPWRLLVTQNKGRKSLKYNISKRKYHHITPTIWYHKAHVRRRFSTYMYRYSAVKIRHKAKVHGERDRNIDNYIYAWKICNDVYSSSRRERSEKCRLTTWSWYEIIKNYWHDIYG